MDDRAPLLRFIPQARPCPLCGGVEHPDLGLVVHESALCPGVAVDALMLGSALCKKPE